MAPRTLFRVILKILGIFFIKDIITAIPQFISAFFYFGNAISADTGF